MLRISYEIPSAPQQVAFLSHQLCRLWKRFIAVLERGLAAVPAHRLALSARPAPLVLIFLLLVGRVGLFPLFAASCLLSSGHCSSSHQILEFNPKPNQQEREKGEDNKCIPHFNIQWLPWVCFGIFIVTPWKIYSSLLGIIILSSSYADCPLSAPQFIRKT